MHIHDALVLGFVQGLTEFLPISSTGHLILAREVFGYAPESGLAFDALLHLATALAVAVYFRRDLLGVAGTAFRMVRGRPTESPSRTLLYALILGTLPAVFFGLLLEDTMEFTFRSASLVAWVLLAGSGLFLVAEYVGARYHSDKPMTLHTGLAVGFFQALALIPGMSRSGSTIAGGLLLGLSRYDAARFGFLLSFPIIVGAGSKKLYELFASGVFEADFVPILAGTCVSFAAGLAAIHWLIRYLKTRTLVVFVVYRVAIALAVLVFV